MLKNKGKVLLIAIVLSITGVFTSLADGPVGWRQTENGAWQYYTKTGELATNKWAKSGEFWYYFDESGNMAFNTLIDYDNKTYHVDSEGKMSVNQWVNYNEVYYYAGEDGIILKSTITPDGYTVDENGAWNQSVPQKSLEQIIAEEEAKQFLPDEKKQTLWEKTKKEAKRRLKYPNTSHFPEWTDEGVSFFVCDDKDGTEVIQVDGWCEAKNGMGNYLEISIRAYYYADTFGLITITINK